MRFQYTCVLMLIGSAYAPKPPSKPYLIAKTISEALDRMAGRDASLPDPPAPGTCEAHASCAACAAGATDGTPCSWNQGGSSFFPGWAGFSGCAAVNGTSQTAALLEECAPRPRTPFVFIPSMAGSLFTWTGETPRESPCAKVKATTLEWLYINIPELAAAFLSGNEVDDNEAVAALLSKMLPNTPTDLLLEVISSLGTIEENQQARGCWLYMNAVNFDDDPAQVPSDNEGVTSDVRDWGGVRGLVPGVTFMPLWAAGYVPGETFYAAPYDWRKSTFTYLEQVYFGQLKLLIEQAVADNGGRPAVVGCHSQGCPVGTHFLNWGGVDAEWKAAHVKSLFLASSASGGSTLLPGAMSCGDFGPTETFQGKSPWMAPFYQSPFGPYEWPTAEFNGEFSVFSTGGYDYTTSAPDAADAMATFGLRDAWEQQIVPALAKTTGDPGVPTFAAHGVGVPNVRHVSVDDASSHCTYEIPTRQACADAWAANGVDGVVAESCGDGTILPQALMYPELNWASHQKSSHVLGMKHAAAYSNDEVNALLIGEVLGVPCEHNPLCTAEKCPTGCVRADGTSGRRLLFASSNDLMQCPGGCVD